MSRVNKLVDMLDKVASSVEEKGYLKEAKHIDIIANTIEANTAKMRSNVKKTRNLTRTIKQLKKALNENPEAKRLLQELSGKNGEEAFIYILAKLGGDIRMSDFNISKKYAIRLLRNDMDKDPDMLVKEAGLKLALDEKVINLAVLICLAVAIDTGINSVEDIEYRDLDRLAKSLYSKGDTESRA